jgi:hypothetical protein
MTITVDIKYTKEEIETLLKTLYIIQSFDETEQSLPKSVDDLSNRAFDSVADLLCLDPEGERAFQNEGW